MVKKSISFLLILMVFFTVFSGCAPKTENNNQASQAESGASTAAGETSAATQSGGQEKMEISVAQWGNENWKTDDFWFTALNDKFNIDIKPIAVTWADWIEKLKMWAASGQLPDVFVLDNGMYFNWAKQGILKGIDVQSLEKYQYLRDRTPNTILDAITIDGKIFAIPRSNWKNSSNPVDIPALWVWKPFLEKAGLETAPDTLDGWYDFLKKCVQEDYSGTGNIIGVTGGGSNLGALNRLLLSTCVPNYGYWIEEDGKWIPGYYSKNHVEALETARKWYKEGIIDKDFAARKGGDNDQMFAKGTLAVYSANGDPDWLDTMGGMGNWKPDEKVVLALPPKAADGKRYYTPTSNLGGYTGINANVSDSKLERILTLFDWFTSPEGTNFCVFGIEGENYKKEGDKIVSLVPKDDNGSTRNFWQFCPSAEFGRFIVTWNFEAAFDNPVHSPEVVKLSKDYYDSARTECTILDPNFKVQLLSTPEKDKLPNLETEYFNMFVKIMMSDDDIEKTFSKFVEDSMKKYEAAIKEVNEAAANLK